MKPSCKRTNLCEILTQQIPQHNSFIIPCCPSLLCCRSLFHAPLMVAIWGASVFKLPSPCSADNQITCLIYFFFLTKMIQANMCEFHQLNLSSIQMIYPYIIFLVLIFRFKEERVSESWISSSQHGCLLESIRKYYMFWCPGTPRPVKSEALEVGSRHLLFLRLPSDSMMHPSLRTSALFGLRSTLKGVLHPSFPSFSTSSLFSHFFCFLHSTFQNL